MRLEETIQKDGQRHLYENVKKLTLLVYVICLKMMLKYYCGQKLR